MLQTHHNLTMAEYGPQPVDDGPNLEAILAAVRRRAWLVVLCAIAGGLFGLAYLVAAVPFYTSSTQLLIDTRDTQSAQEAAVMPDVVFDDMAAGKPTSDELIADDLLHLLLAHRRETPVESVGRVKELLSKWHYICTPLDMH